VRVDSWLILSDPEGHRWKLYVDHRRKVALCTLLSLWKVLPGLHRSTRQAMSFRKRRVQDGPQHKSSLFHLQLTIFEIVHSIWRLRSRAWTLSLILCFDREQTLVL
jgi:hypothetical protein